MILEVSSRSNLSFLFFSRNEKRINNFFLFFFFEVVRNNKVIVRLEVIKAEVVNEVSIVAAVVWKSSRGSRWCAIALSPRVPRRLERMRPWREPWRSCWNVCSEFGAGRDRPLRGLAPRLMVNYNGCYYWNWSLFGHETIYNYECFLIMKKRIQMPRVCARVCMCMLLFNSLRLVDIYAFMKNVFIFYTFVQNYFISYLTWYNVCMFRLFIQWKIRKKYHMSLYEYF